MATYEQEMDYQRRKKVGESADAAADVDAKVHSSAAGLGSVKPSAPAAEETDVSKMSPLQRAAYEAKKKREGGPTGYDAARALANRK